MSIGFPSAAAGADGRDLAAIVNRLNVGKINCTGTLVLTPGEATTAVADSRAAVGSFIGLTPLSASAAVEWSNGELYVAGRATGGFTLAHASSPAADRLFAYVIIG